MWLLSQMWPTTSLLMNMIAHWDLDNIPSSCHIPTSSNSLICAVTMMLAKNVCMHTHIHTQTDRHTHTRTHTHLSFVGPHEGLYSHVAVCQQHLLSDWVLLGQCIVDHVYSGWTTRGLLRWPSGSDKTTSLVCVDETIQTHMYSHTGWLRWPSESDSDKTTSLVCVDETIQTHTCTVTQATLQVMQWMWISIHTVVETCERSRIPLGFHITQ